MNWDTAVALAYAAEQLFVAAQASDLVMPERGLTLAQAHLKGLRRHDELLPPHIRERLSKLDDAYVERAKHLDSAADGALGQETMSALAEIRDVLAEMEKQQHAA